MIFDEKDLSQLEALTKDCINNFAERAQALKELDLEKLAEEGRLDDFPEDAGPMASILKMMPLETRKEIIEKMLNDHLETAKIGIESLSALHAKIVMAKAEALA